MIQAVVFGLMALVNIMFQIVQPLRHNKPVKVVETVGRMGRCILSFIVNGKMAHVSNGVLRTNVSKKILMLIKNGAHVPFFIFFFLTFFYCIYDFIKNFRGFGM